MVCSLSLQSVAVPVGGGGGVRRVFDAGYHVDRHSEVDLGPPRGDNYKSLTFTPTQTNTCPRRVRSSLRDHLTIGRFVFSPIIF